MDELLKYGRAMESANGTKETIRILNTMDETVRAWDVSTTVEINAVLLDILVVHSDDRKPLGVRMEALKVYTWLVLHAGEDDAIKADLPRICMSSFQNLNTCKFGLLLAKRIFEIGDSKPTDKLLVLDVLEHIIGALITDDPEPQHLALDCLAVLVERDELKYCTQLARMNNFWKVMNLLFQTLKWERMHLVLIMSIFRKCESDTNLVKEICEVAHRSHIITSLLDYFQGRDTELAIIAINAIGAVASAVPSVLSKSSQLVIIRVFFNVVDGSRGIHLLSSLINLKKILAVEDLTDLVIDCGAVRRCAITGTAVLRFTDDLSKNICNEILSIMQFVQDRPDRSDELLDSYCVDFLVKCLDGLSEVKNDFSDLAFVVPMDSLYLLMKISESASTSWLSSGAAARALAKTVKRQDDVGFLCLLASSVFVGKSQSERVSVSQDMPKVSPYYAQYFLGLMDQFCNSSTIDVPKVGLLFERLELVQYMYYLSRSNYNKTALRPLIPALVSALETETNEDILKVTLETLLMLSYNKQNKMILAKHSPLPSLHRVKELGLLSDHYRLLETLKISLQLNGSNTVNGFKKVMRRLSSKVLRSDLLEIISEIPKLK